MQERLTDLSQAVPKHARPNFNIPIAQELKCHYHDPDRGNMLACKQSKYQHLSKQAPPPHYRECHPHAEYCTCKNKTLPSGSFTVMELARGDLHMEMCKWTYTIVAYVTLPYVMTFVLRSLGPLFHSGITMMYMV